MKILSRTEISLCIVALLVGCSALGSEAAGDRAEREHLFLNLPPIESGFSKPSQPGSGATTIRMPQPGDKLGYSKEESEKRLAPEVKALLDGALKLYYEPGIFSNRKAAVAALNVTKWARRWHPRTIPEYSITRSFTDQFDQIGNLDSSVWSGEYHYSGQSRDHLRWGATIQLNVDSKKICVDSRAVEGYLDLSLEPGIGGHAHPLGPDEWDRHGRFGEPSAARISNLLPALKIYFSRGCLTTLVINGFFEYKEIGDLNVY